MLVITVEVSDHVREPALVTRPKARLPTPRTNSDPRRTPVWLRAASGNPGNFSTSPTVTVDGVCTTREQLEITRSRELLSHLSTSLFGTNFLHRFRCSIDE